MRISKLGEMGRGKRYPRALLEKLLVVYRREATAGRDAVGGGRRAGNELEDAGDAGSAERKTASRFERVQVGSPAAAVTSATLIVHGPRGLRIEGLDVGGVVELVRRLGE